MSKFLIINADDFGYNKEQNGAVKFLLEKKLISSVSYMAVAPEFPDTLNCIFPEDISAGVHLTINSDSKTAPWRGISDGRILPNDSKKLTFATSRKYVRSELEAQYDLLLKSDIKIDHADNHCATLYGINGRAFFLDAFDFCAAHNLPFRFPKTSGFLSRQLGVKVPSAVKAFQNAIVKSGEKRKVKMLDDLASNPWNVEKIGSFENLRQYYLDIVDSCIDGITEIFLHPALPLDTEQGEWQKRVWEFEILKSGCLLERAEKKGIKVVSWSIFDEI